jgi:3-hydroxybutyryl-CoA dehydrogenase
VSTERKTVAVLGAGTMGSGIATVMARAGHRTILYDINEANLQRGIDTVYTFVDKSVRIGKLDEAAGRASKDALSGSTELGDLAPCDVVVEAVFEDLALKKDTFGRLDEIVSESTLLHTNTSTLSVTGIASGSRLPERVVGTHYCNPAPLMKLVEVADGRHTADWAHKATIEFLGSLGKTSVVTKDRPGFIVNRFLIPWENSCVRALDWAPRSQSMRRCWGHLATRWAHSGCWTSSDWIFISRSLRVSTSSFATPAFSRRPWSIGWSPRATSAARPAAGSTSTTTPACSGPKGAKMSESTNDFRTVGLLGFGTMGAGIAQVLAASGRDVAVLETDQARIDAGTAVVASFLDGGIARGKVTEEDKAAVLGCISATTSAADLADVDLVVESVTENSDVKKAVLHEVTGVVGPQIPICTNTSALSVTDLAAALPNPGRTAGLHFFNPVPLMRTVEVVRALQTDDDLIERLVAFVESLEGKVPVVVKDRPGFLVNALLLPYLNDVIQEYDDELASAEDIDLALKLGLGYKSGPLELLDMIGLDVHLHATEAAYAATLDPRYAPPPLLRQMVAAGRLGNKSGHGFRTGPSASKDS